MKTLHPHRTLHIPPAPSKSKRTPSATAPESTEQRNARLMAKFYNTRIIGNPPR